MGRLKKGVEFLKTMQKDDGSWINNDSPWASQVPEEAIRRKALREPPFPLPPSSF